MKGPLFTLVLVLSGWSARAQDLDPAKAAQIEHDQQKLYDEIDKKHGNKKPSELSQDERREIIRERAQAEESVFEKQGVDRKSYTKYITKMGLDDRAAMKDATDTLNKKDDEAAAAAAKKASEPQGEIPIQRGFNDNNPVMLEEKKGAGPVVEKGIPQDAMDDQQAAQQLNESTSEQRPAEKPKAKHGKGK